MSLEVGQAGRGILLFPAVSAPKCIVLFPGQSIGDLSLVQNGVSRQLSV